MLGSPLHGSRCTVGRAHAALLAHVGHYAPQSVRERVAVIEAVDSAVELLWGMRLTRKFIAALVGVALVGLGQSYLDYQRERAPCSIGSCRREAKSLGRALARGVADVWQRDGEAAARQFLESSKPKWRAHQRALDLARRQGPRRAARRARAARADGAAGRPGDDQRPRARPAVHLLPGLGAGLERASAAEARAVVRLLRHLRQRVAAQRDHRRDRRGVDRGDPRRSAWAWRSSAGRSPRRGQGAPRRHRRPQRAARAQAARRALASSPPRST